jgi:hypothetical protein
MVTLRPLLVLIPLALAGCGGTGIKAEPARPGAIVNARTYGVRTGPAGSVPGPAGVAAPGWLATAITDELKARGLSERASPDLDGVARVIVRGQPMVYLRMGPRMAYPKFEKMTWPEGTLIVEFYSERTTDMVWRGTAEGLIRDGVSQENIREAIAEMFKNWAPAGG